MRLVWIDVQVSHLDLRANPGHARFTFEDICVAIFFGQHDRSFARRRDAGGENDLCSFVRHQAHPAPQAENRIEHRAYRVRERAIFHDRDRLSGRVAATQKSVPISFKLNPSDRFDRGRQYVHAPFRLVLCRAWPPARKQCAVRAVALSFNKQVAEGGMGQVVGPRSKDDFGVTGQFDLARTGRVICHRQTAHLSIVFSRDDYFEMGHNAKVAPPKVGFVF